MWCLQFSNRPNGGNQALGAVYSKIQKPKKLKIICLKKNIIKTIIFIFFVCRKAPVIVSDPLCSILLWLSMRSKVVHFVQSDDLNLFQNRGYLFNYIYKKFYRLMILNSNWYRIFNSNYSIICFAKNFKISVDKSMVVPMLGLNNLFPLKYQKQILKKQNDNFIWIGSEHSFKGGKLFIYAVNFSGSKGHMIFNGNIPNWALGHINISTESNLTREVIFSKIRKHAALVYTSSFDSFALPIFEALMLGCHVIAIKNTCIELNKSSNYVKLVSNVNELSKEMAVFNKSNYSPKVKINWKQNHKDFIKWSNQFRNNINTSLGVN